MEGNSKELATVTETVTGFSDLELAKLYKGLDGLAASVKHLNEVSMLNKSAAAQEVLTRNHQLMFAMVSGMHALKNEVERVKLELARIGNIGVIKNG